MGTGPHDSVSILIKSAIAHPRVGPEVTHECNKPSHERGRDADRIRREAGAVRVLAVHELHATGTACGPFSRSPCGVSRSGPCSRRRFRACDEPFESTRADNAPSDVRCRVGARTSRCSPSAAPRPAVVRYRGSGTEAPRMTLDLDTLVLRSGTHTSSSDGVSLMEAVSALASETPSEDE